MQSPGKPSARLPNASNSEKVGILRVGMLLGNMAMVWQWKDWIWNVVGLVAVALILSIGIHLH